MAFTSALTFPWLASPHRVALSRTRFSLDNVKAYNGGDPRLLPWPANLTATKSRFRCFSADVDDGITPEDSEKRAYQKANDFKKFMADLKRKHYEGFSECGLAKVTMNGERKVVAIEIAAEAKELGDENLERITDEAYYDALEKKSLDHEEFWKRFWGP